MDWLVSIVTGFLLWYFLPRGVVLTRTALSEDSRGDPLYDTWLLKNDGPLPLRITSVTFVTPAQWNPDSRSFDEPPLPLEGTEEGIRLTMTDEASEIRREDLRQEWNKIVVPPGDSLLARVPTNTTLKIAYRRSGFGGIVERRLLRVDGGA